MVNKKKKSRQSGPDDHNASDSTESCDENQVENSGGKCPHVLRAVDFARVKKSLKSSGIARECMDCSKSTTNELEKPDEKLEATPGLWLCLRCGHQSCGRDRKQHALKHHQTPQSDSHAIVVNTELWNVWCYDCNFEIPSACKKKLHECLEFIKRQEDAPVKDKKPGSTNTINREKEDSCGKSVSSAIVQSSVGLSPKGKAVPKDLPRVRGLRNNGNTCFFNAVLQCLAHTPFLVNVLQEMKEPGEKFSLPGTQKKDDSDDEDECENAEGEDEDDTFVPPIEGELGKWGALTETLAATLTELQSSNADVYNPDPLMKKLMQKCPLFEGNDQHDSQELLRHLLEGVRSEDLKRYQSAILHKLGLSEKCVPSAVDESRRFKAKLYGRQASELSLRPDQVFRGSLVSTLECQDCKHASQRTETFLDLSLPLMADKPQPPMVMRRKSSEDSVVDFCGKSTSNQPSKHQVKKEKKLARKGKKRQGSKGRISESGEGAEATIVEDAAEANASGESEESDADVEDNVEQDGENGAQTHDVGESGYSSEKAANEDSTVESPVSHAAMNGDSVLGSPASPAHNGERHNAIALPYKSSIPQPSLNQEVHASLSDTEEVVFEFSQLPQRPATSPTQSSDTNLATPARVTEGELQYATISTINSVNTAVNGGIEMSNENLPQGECLEPLDKLSCRSPDDDCLNLKSYHVCVAKEALTLIPASVAVPTTEELAISIPPSPTVREHSQANKESPCSNPDSVSAASSEVNLEMASPCHGELASPTFSSAVDFERPVSRFAFNDQEDVTYASPARGSPAEDMCSSPRTYGDVTYASPARGSPAEDMCSSPRTYGNVTYASPARGSPAEDMCSSLRSYGDDMYASKRNNYEENVKHARSSPAEQMCLTANDWPINHETLVSSLNEFKFEGPVMDLELGMQSLSLNLDEKLSHNDDILAEISEDEVNHLIKELSKEKLNVSEEEPKLGEISEVLKNVGLADKTVADDGLVYGPFPNENLYPIVSASPDVAAVGDASPTKDRKRSDSVSWSTTLMPKYTTDDGECSIMSCLNQFTAIELMTGNNKVGCEACTERQNQGKEGKMVTTNSTKQFLLSSPPPVLILHLKRFQLQRSLLKKMGRHVNFPRLLDLAPLISTKSKDSATVSCGQRQVIYSVYGIVEHSGTLQYGHYIAYVKVRAPVTPDNPRWRFLYPDGSAKQDPERLDNVEPPPGKWYCVSDSRVNEVSEDKVMRSEAYLLFYERIW